MVVTVSKVVVSVQSSNLWLPMGLPKPPMKEVVGEAGEPSAPSRAVSGFISVQSAECRVQSAECRVQSAECRVGVGK